MSTAKEKKTETGRFKEYKLHTPTSGRDTGFTLPGYKLRWIGAHQSERKPGRMWTPLKVSDLPVKLKTFIEETRPLWLRWGDTIRAGGDILAWASLDAVKQKRAEIDAETKDLHALLSQKRGYTSRAGGIESQGSVRKGLNAQDFG